MNARILDPLNGPARPGTGLRRIVAQIGLQRSLALLKSRDLSADFHQFIGQGQSVHLVLGSCPSPTPSGNLLNNP